MANNYPIRALTPAEYDVCVAMVLRAQGNDCSVSAKDRERWLGLLSDTRVSGICGCGLCPSIDLIYSGHAPKSDSGTSVILQAETALGDAIVVLIIDHDRLASLEVAPMGDEPVDLPAPDDLRFG